ncbi:hydroxymethylcytosylglucuronate/cytosylglucuronate synthase [Streptomyces sp. PT12]|uniref:hydroxymethylcytosylglucuronate/cytosylglucurona te synthase n=1 Tax=Streptomyces sp. PT12 TaxID=1510197 RepID=UPI0015EF3425|nr:hydroxymethylcytosylglucuronate/cytosylglucuronate synthase [Streptomyces sp. PT12]
MNAANDVNGANAVSAVSAVNDVNGENGERPLTVAVVGVEFGWGSAGLLDSIVGRLRAQAPGPVRLIGVSSGLGRPLLDEIAVERWYGLSGAEPRRYAEVAAAEGVDVALSVLDAPAAKSWEAAGVRTVFVDVLSFLWTMGDRDWLPGAVTRYCAQRCPELPDEARRLLAHVERLEWVGGILPEPPRGGAPPREPRPGHAVIALGGLRSPLVTDPLAYPRLVVPPVLRALAALGFTSAHLAGNVPASLADELRPRAVPGMPAVPDLEITAGMVPHGRFRAALGEAEMVLTQPGLMSLLEAGATGVPLVRLPPQNVAGILQARFHEAATRSGCGVPWPPEVLDEERVLAARARGEEAANRLHYGRVAWAAAHPRQVRPALRAATEAAVARARTVDPARWTAFTDAIGTEGAATVAARVLALGDEARRRRAAGRAS